MTTTSTPPPDDPIPDDPIPDDPIPDDPIPDDPTRAERVLEAIGGVQALAIGVTRQATEFAADRLPAVPGFPGDALDAPTAIVDRVFESVEDALATRSPTARDVVHQQGTFVRGIFGSIQPVVDALSGRREPRPDRPVTR